jgi:LEA14-like dessication related protein
MDRAPAQRLATSVALLLVGCAGIKSVADERPTADMVGAHLVSLGFDRSTVGFDVKIHNPYDVDLPLTDVRYGISSEGEEFLTGVADLSGVVPAGGDHTVTIPATIVYDELLAVLERIRPGQVLPYVAELAVAVSAPGGTRFEIPLNRTGELPIPALPLVEVVRVDWSELGLEGAKGTLHLSFGNTNDFPLEVGGLDYNLSLGGHTIATTHLEEALSLERRGTGTMAIDIHVPASNLATGLIGLLRDGRVDYSLDGVFSVTTPYGDMKMPLDRSGKTVVATEVSQ